MSANPAETLGTDVDTMRRVARSVWSNFSRILSDVQAVRSRPLTRGGLADLLSGDAAPSGDVIGLATALNNAIWLRNQLSDGADANFRAFLPQGTEAPRSVGDMIDALLALQAEIKHLDAVALRLGNKAGRPGPRRKID